MSPLIGGESTMSIPPDGLVPIPPKTGIDNANEGIVNSPK